MSAARQVGRHLAIAGATVRRPGATVDFIRVGILSTDREKRERFAEHFDAEAANSALESCSLCQASFPQAVGKDRKVLGAADREPVRDI